MSGLVGLLASILVPSVRAAEFDHALVVILDDVGTDKVGAYAEDVDNPTETRPETPTLDMVAAAGVRFSDAWASPLCSPTRAMVLTGEYAYRTGVGHALGSGADIRLPPTSDTLARLAQDNGLRTALFGKWHLGKTATTLSEEGVLAVPEYPVRLGFDYFAGSMNGSVESYTDWLLTVSRRVSLGSARYETIATEETVSATDFVTDAAVDWMSRVPGRRRFTVVSYNLAHDSPGGETGYGWEDGALSCGAKNGTDVENMKAMVECADAALGELLANTPDLDRTLVVVLGDNGTEHEVAEGLFADGRGKATPYENGIRVPFLVADGGALQAAFANGGHMPPYNPLFVDVGAVVYDPVSVVDVFATVADLLDLSDPDCVPGLSCATDSVSLRSVLTGGPSLRRDVWSEVWVEYPESNFGRAALRIGDMKLIVKVDRYTNCRRFELYDLSVDRWEEEDLFDDAAYAAQQARLLERLDSHEGEMRFPWMPPDTCS